MNWIKRSQIVLQKTHTHTAYDRNTPFGQYVSRLQNIKRKEKEYRQRENQLPEVLDRKERKETGTDLDQMEEEAQSNLDTVYDILEEERNELKHNDLAFLSGPVTSNLDNVLQKKQNYNAGVSWAYICRQLLP